ncbi:MAG: 3-deoxy-8-phosphooctulonate synthase [Cyclobacteriaceae bacterium]|nr:3-deoxy-8-phosphooctulonate synthase [Cyclobacteriaceae bacterium]
MSEKTVKVGQISCGSGELFLISGPCVIEREPVMMETAEKLKKMAERLNLPLIYKSSYQKDNRSDVNFYQGPGLEEGLRTLEKIKNTFDLPVLSDVHYPDQVQAASEVLDIIQIPAYLCMQTTLVVAAARTGKTVNLKHGQFLAPENMIKPVKKVESTGNNKILLTERGYTFGYNDLVVDPRSFYHLNETGYPVIFDITHSIRKYGIPSADPGGGARQYLNVLARAGVAAGVDGIFIEAHPCPAEALCDAASQYDVNELEEFIKPLIEIHQVNKKYHV